MIDILSILKSTKALLTDDHFVYTSGKHGSVYINKDILYTNPEKSSLVGKAFAEKSKDFSVDGVEAPALGGIVLSQWTAYHLSLLLNRPVLAVYTEKTPEKDQIFTRGYDAVINKRRVLIVEDLVTTGGSVQKVIESVKKANGNVVSVGVMVDRSPQDSPVTSKTIGAQFFSLGRLPVEIYDVTNCPLCKENVPINIDVGHGKKFLQLKRFSEKIAKKRTL